MTTINVVLPALFPAQEVIFRDRARFRVLVAGRRFGKSRLACAMILDGLFRGQNLWWIAPTFDISKRVGWKMITAALRPLIANGYAEANKSDLLITLPNGGSFQAKSADRPDKLVGEGLDGVVLDECGIIHEMAWLESIRPALTDRLGWGVFIGTPKGRNWFWRAFQDGLDPLISDWSSWQHPTSDNPYIDAGEIENAQTRLPERVFRQEYLAEFLEDGGAVFRNVTACIQPPPGKRGKVVIGVDWGRSSDYTVLIAMDRQSRRVLEIDRFNQINWTLQRGRLLEMARRYDTELILAESNSMGEPNIEELQKTGLPVRGFQTTAASKGQIIDGLALAFEQQTIGIPDDPVLLGELQAYEMERLSSGNWRYSAPDGGHDDCVIALALAYHAAQRSSHVLIHSAPSALSDYRG